MPSSLGPKPSVSSKLIELGLGPPRQGYVCKECQRVREMVEAGLQQRGTHPGVGAATILLLAVKEMVAAGLPQRGTHPGVAAVTIHPA